MTKPAAVAAAFLVSFIVTAHAHADVREDLAAAKRTADSGNLEKARLDYLEIAREHGDESGGREAWWHLALLSRSGEDYLHYLEEYLENGGRKDRRGPYAELRAGRYFYSLGEYRTALTRFESARELRRDDAAAAAEARYWVGMTLLALREPADARRSLEEAAMAKSPGRIREAALYALGELLRTNRDNAGAARAFAECREQFPKGDYAAAALLGEAVVKDQLGRKDEAEELYELLLERYAAWPEAGEARQRLRAAERAREEVVPDTTSVPWVTDSVGTHAQKAVQGESGDAVGYSVQIGAFASEENAVKLADDLLVRGYTRVRIEQDDVEPYLYRVRFGNYPDHPRAERAGQEASASLGADFRIVPPPSEANR